MDERCRWCGRNLSCPRPGPGAVRRYCRQGCRQQAHLARKLAAAHGLGADDAIVSRPALDELQGRLYCLQAALQDVERDLAAMPSEPATTSGELRWILGSSRTRVPAAALWIEPRTGST